MWRDHKKESLNKSVRFPKVEERKSRGGSMELRNLEKAEGILDGYRRADTAPCPWADIPDKPVSHLLPQDPITASGVHLNFGGCHIFGTHLLKSWGECCSRGVYTSNSLFSPRSKPPVRGILGKGEPSLWVTSLGTGGEQGCQKTVY